MYRSVAKSLLFGITYHNIQHTVDANIHTSTVRSFRPYGMGSYVSQHVVWLRYHLLYWYFTTDVDECAEDSVSCDINATCINTAGSFECICNEGFEGNGTTCTGKLT